MVSKRTQSYTSLASRDFGSGRVPKYRNLNSAEPRRRPNQGPAGQRRSRRDPVGSLASRYLRMRSAAPPPPAFVVAEYQRPALNRLRWACTLPQLTYRSPSRFIDLADHLARLDLPLSAGVMCFWRDGQCWCCARELKAAATRRRCLRASQPAGSLGSVLGRPGEPRDQGSWVKSGKADLTGVVRVCQGSKTADD